MVQYFPYLLLLMVAIMLLIMLANRLKVAYPILLVLGGLAISLIPNMPAITLNPDLVLIIFLPPLLYTDVFSLSLKEMWKWRRIILSFAFPVVFITACAVALVANAILPGFSIALGFLLGGIVSPPDAVSAQAIMRFVKVPKRFSSILEGESLFNDASSLIIMRVALVAVGTGQFVWYQAAGSFVWMLVGGLLVGLAVAWVMIKLHHYLPTDEKIDVVFTLITPYIMYIAAEEVGASGVIAVVSGGLYLSSRNTLFMDSSSRLSGWSFWHNFVFLLNGLVFLLIGLDLPEVVAGMREGGMSLSTATWYGLLISAVLILIRLVCSYGAVMITLFMRRFIKVADPNYYGLRVPFVLGWSGMRGVVSLAAALSIPLLTDEGLPFPERSMIIYITFVVILVTLLLQGLTLPILINRMTFPVFNDHLPEQETELIIRKGLADVSLRYLRENELCESVSESHLLQTMVTHWLQQLEEEGHTPLYDTSSELYCRILDQQRLYLYHLNKEQANIDEDIVNRFIRRIDLE